MPNNEIERKLAQLQAWTIAALSFLFVSVVGLLLAGLWISSGSVSDAKHKSDQALACYVQPQLARALKTLPTLDYYVNHPDELETQLAVVREQQQLALDAWGKCERLFSAS